jgi:hypothetical protein
MIELLLEAERALTHGLVDQAERLYGQVAAADPRNSIAAVGLARVALERGDELNAYLHARTALKIDPENPAAQHLVMRMTEVLAGRGESVPAADEAAPPATPPAPPAPSPPDTIPLVEPAGGADVEPADLGERPRLRKPGLVGRLLRRRPRS